MCAPDVQTCSSREESAVSEGNYEPDTSHKIVPIETRPTPASANYYPEDFEEEEEHSEFFIVLLFE